MNAIQAHVQRGIDAEGYTIMAVHGSETSPPFAYTIGRVAKGLPELILFGLGQMNAYIVLTRLVKLLESGEDIIEGEKIHDLVNLPVALKNVAPGAAAEWEIQGQVWRKANNFPEPQFKQLVMPDPMGRLPWEEGYDLPKESGGQPLLYLSQFH